MITEQLKNILLSPETIEKYRKICGHKAYKEELHCFIIKHGLIKLEELLKEVNINEQT